VTSALVAGVLTVAALTGRLPPASVGREVKSATALAASPDSRVRGFDEISRDVLRAGVACSPTVARMVVDLQASDLIVGVEAAPLEKTIRGELRLVATSGRTRYVRIRLRIPTTGRQLVSVLGHELQHAMEVAGAPEVRDAATQRAYYLRVGYERLGGGRFETDAALEVGRRVEREVGGCAALRLSR